MNVERHTNTLRQRERERERGREGEGTQGRECESAREGVRETERNKDVASYLCV